jgi:hypothetical protein
VNAGNPKVLESLHRGDSFAVLAEVSQQALTLALFLGRCFHGLILGGWNSNPSFRSERFNGHSVVLGVIGTTLLNIAIRPLVLD